MNRGLYNEFEKEIANCETSITDELNNIKRHENYIINSKESIKKLQQDLRNKVKARDLIFPDKEAITKEDEPEIIFEKIKKKDNRGRPKKEIEIKEIELNLDSNEDINVIVQEEIKSEEKIEIDNQDINDINKKEV